jgi:hypothetical protein
VIIGYGTREHVWEPACPGGSLCRYCGKESDDVLHVVVLGNDGPDVVEYEQAIPLVLLDLAASRGDMLNSLVKITENGLQQTLRDSGLRARGAVVLTINVRVEAS